MKSDLVHSIVQMESDLLKQLVTEVKKQWRLMSRCPNA